MEDINMILIIFLLLVILYMILTHVNVDFYNYPTTPTNGKCSETKFGCCPDGKNSKINFYGTNCPPYNPGAGYDPTHETQPQTQPQPNPYPPVPNPPIPVPPGPQPYYASQTQPQQQQQQPEPQPQTQSQTYYASQPQQQTQTYASRPRPLRSLSSTSNVPYTSHPLIEETSTSPDYTPGPRPPKAAGGIGTRYPN